MQFYFPIFNIFFLIVLCLRFCKFIFVYIFSFVLYVFLDHNDLLYILYFLTLLLSNQMFSLKFFKNNFSNKIFRISGCCIAVVYAANNDFYSRAFSCYPNFIIYTFSNLKQDKHALQFFFFICDTVVVFTTAKYQHEWYTP